MERARPAVMIEAIFETHATSVDNERGLASGRHDAPLSALGERQAAELGERYPAGTIDAVYCSDLQRSYRTAELAFAGRDDVPIRQDVRLRECDYGRLTRRPHSEIAVLRARHVRAPFPEGESYVDCASRVASFLSDLRTDRKGGRVLIIGHRATQLSLEHLLRGTPLEEAIVAPWSWRPGWVYMLDGQE